MTAIAICQTQAVQGYDFSFIELVMNQSLHKETVLLSCFVSNAFSNDAFRKYRFTYVHKSFGNGESTTVETPSIYLSLPELFNFAVG